MWMKLLFYISQRLEPLSPMTLDFGGNQNVEEVVSNIIQKIEPSFLQ